MLLFKVWDRNRHNKTFVTVNDENNIYENLILSTSEKLNIDGSVLVLERDGTPVDEDAVLLLIRSETLILLQRNEIWKPEDSIDNISTATTITNSSISLQDLLNETTVYTETQPVQENAVDMPTETNSEVVWTNFKIPWDKIPQCMIDTCAKGDREYSTLTEIVHIIVNEMRQIKTAIPSKSFKIIAKKMIDKYPDFFKDVDDDGVVLGDGSHSLFAKLQDRNNYLNRPHKTNRINQEESVAPSKRKKLNNAKSGCSNWQPSLEFSHSTTDTDLKLNSPDITDNEFYALLDKTYPQQRHYLNNHENSILNIKEHWPVLLKTEVIFWHFQKLTNQNIHVLATKLMEKTDKILGFGKAKKLLSNDVLIKTDSEKYIESLKIVARYFNEDWSYILYTFKDTASENNIRGNLKLDTPCIIELENENEKTYKIYIGKEEVNQDTNDFLTGLKIFFALFYNFNLEYPKEVSFTMELIQRYFLKIHPDSGTKSKKNKSSKQKVFSLMNKLKHF